MTALNVNVEDTINENISDEASLPLPSPTSSLTSNVSTPSGSASKKTKLDQMNRAFTESMASFQDYLKTRTSSTLSEGQKFGQTVGNIYESLNESHKKEAKIEIIKYLLSLQEDELNT